MPCVNEPSPFGRGQGEGVGWALFTIDTVAVRVESFRLTRSQRRRRYTKNASVAVGSRSNDLVTPACGRYELRVYTITTVGDAHPTKGGFAISYSPSPPGFGHGPHGGDNLFELQQVVVILVDGGKMLLENVDGFNLFFAQAAVVV